MNEIKIKNQPFFESSAFELELDEKIISEANSYWNWFYSSLDFYFTNKRIIKIITPKWSFWGKKNNIYQSIYYDDFSRITYPSIDLESPEEIIIQDIHDNQITMDGLSHETAKYIADKIFEVGDLLEFMDESIYEYWFEGKEEYTRNENEYNEYRKNQSS